VQFVVGDYRFMSAAAVNGDIDGKDNVSHFLFFPCYGISRNFSILAPVISERLLPSCTAFLLPA
jgi:hypothetical protein